MNCWTRCGTWRLAASGSCTFVGGKLKYVGTVATWLANCLSLAEFLVLGSMFREVVDVMAGALFRAPGLQPQKAARTVAASVVDIILEHLCCCYQ